MKIKKPKKPTTLRRFRQLLEKHLLDTGIVESSIYPPTQAEESARARYLASNITSELMKTEKDEMKAGRIRAVTIIELYRMLLGGSIQQTEVWIRQKEAVVREVQRAAGEAVAIDAGLVETQQNEAVEEALAAPEELPMEGPKGETE